MEKGRGEDVRVYGLPLSMNRKEERLLSPALPSTEEGREKRARGWFGGSMRECFRGSLSSVLSPLVPRGERMNSLMQRWQITGESARETNPAWAGSAGILAGVFPVFFRSAKNGLAGKSAGVPSQVHGQALIASRSMNPPR